jgi:hypothetical protein
LSLRMIFSHGIFQSAMFEYPSAWALGPMFCHRPMESGHPALSVDARDETRGHWQICGEEEGAPALGQMSWSFIPFLGDKPSKTSNTWDLKVNG